MTKQQEADSTASDERPRARSPQFPFIALKKAISKAYGIEAEYKKSAGRIANVMAVWGLTPKSSGGLQTIAALKSFGLIDDEGKGKDRKVRLSDLALTILKDGRPGKREEAIRQAALKPKALAELWSVWADDRPPDVECISELTLDRHYTDDAAVRLLRVYDDTIGFAKLGESDSEFDKSREGQLENQPPLVGVGDFVQWEPDGVLQFADPKRVKEISPDGKFVLVDGESNAGLPIEEITVMEQTGEDNISELPPARFTMDVQAPVPSVRKDVWNLDEGPVVLQYPSKMTEGSYEDFESWINLQLRKIKRGISN